MGLLAGAMAMGLLLRVMALLGLFLGSLFYVEWCPTVTA